MADQEKKLSFKLLVETIDPEAVIPMKSWGKDHWSTLAYLWHRVMDNKGVIDNRNLRCHTDGRHPHFAHSGSGPGGEYATRLKDNIEMHDHDEWDCIEDMIAEGLVQWEGTGLNPIFKLTERGHRIASEVMDHKARGGVFAKFVPKGMR